MIAIDVVSAVADSEASAVSTAGTAAVETVPADLLQTILREHLAEPCLWISDLQVEPIASGGFSGNRLYRARVGWTGVGPAAGTASANWVLKRWLPGGHGERVMGVDRPLEVLAWQQGILRPEAMPAGVVAPIIGARLDPDGAAGWIVMEDAAAALAEYSRDRPLRPDDAVARAKQALDGFARLHARWERPRLQAMLRRCPWLVRMERFLWCEAASYASALGRPTPAGVAPGSAVTDEFRADLHAFLAWLPAGDRRLWEGLLCNREPLVAALRELPRTLLHGDPDDRNIGLRRRPRQASPHWGAGYSPELILVDWEWIGVGPPALDVARLCSSFPVVCDRSEPPPKAIFSDELPEHYFERYRAHGGMLADCATWRRSFVLAQLALGMGQVAFFGSMVRQGIGPAVAIIAHQIEAATRVARSLLAA